MLLPNIIYGHGNPLYSAAIFFTCWLHVSWLTNDIPQKTTFSFENILYFPEIHLILSLQKAAHNGSGVLALGREATVARQFIHDNLIILQIKPKLHTIIITHRF